MKEEINEYLEKLVKDKIIPGCCWCIITPHETISDSIGYKSLVPSKLKNTTDTLYDIASLTKLIVTNTLASFLIRDEKLKLNNYVKDYILDFPFDNVKIIHLLTHSSGIIPKYDKFNLKSKDEFINNIDLKFEPGTDVLYCDNNFILLGFIIEKLYGKSLDILAKELIFEPLEMYNTSYNPSNIKMCAPTELTKQRGLLQGKAHDEKTYFLNGISGHAGVFSTILDISNYVKMVLNDGYYKGKQFIELNYIDMWFTPLFINEEGVRRTIGWIYGKSSKLCKKVCSDDAIIHTGFTGNHILIDRGNDVAFIFLSNSVHPKRENNKMLIERREYINDEIYRLLKKYDYI